MNTLMLLFAPKKTPTDAFKPLPYYHFFTYFLVPHVAATLIAEDRKTSVTNGFIIMKSSSDVGALLNPEDDGDSELDEIYRATLALFKTRKGPIKSAEDHGESMGAAKAPLQLKRHGVQVYDDYLRLFLPFCPDIDRTWKDAPRPSVSYSTEPKPSARHSDDVVTMPCFIAYLLVLINSVAR